MRFDKEYSDRLAAQRRASRNNERQTMTGQGYRIWARVSGGITGTREAWLKEGDEIWESTNRAEAETKAKDLNVRMNRRGSLADFRYTVKEAL